MEAAALVNDDFALVAVGTDDVGTDVETHLLLSTRNLRWQGNLNYGHDMTHNSIAATNGQGRWITWGQDATARLWQLCGPAGDVAPGQLHLW